MDYFPLFCYLKDKDCLLVGGGEIAERKARLLLASGAKLTVNASAFTPQFQRWAESHRVTLIARPFDKSLLKNQWLAIAATNNPAINERVFHEANALRIFCNRVDASDQTGFIMPSIVDRSPMLIAISSCGKAPVLARMLREKIEATLPVCLGHLASYAGILRQRVKHQFSKITSRRRFWEKLLSNDQLATALVGQRAELVNSLTERLFSTPIDDKGEVMLVGAGPGDADLLTLKGLQCIQRADTLIYDDRIADALLNLARRDAERILVPQRTGQCNRGCSSINQILLAHARAGKRIALLKSGDPTLFEFGDEREYLTKMAIPFCIVPGITAVSGACAYAGMPLTHQDYAHSVQLISLNETQNGTLHWPALSAKRQTLVFYADLLQAGMIQTRLINNGMKGSTPVMIVSRGTTAEQRLATGCLIELGRLAQGLPNPAIVIVGDIVHLYRPFRPQPFMPIGPSTEG